MKYFAKWIPVEGEIEKGDYFQIEKDSVGMVTSIEGNKFSAVGITGFFATKKSSTNHVVNLRQKMVLFLCTRDIKVGEDFVHIERGEGVFTVADELDLQVMEGWKNMKKVYKVIGLISSEAKWIREGDEFDEERIQITCNKTLTEWLWMMPPTNYSPCESAEIIKKKYEEWTKTAEKVILIKGPCGHFH